VGKLDYKRCRAELKRYETEQPQAGALTGLSNSILDIQESVRASLGPAPAVSAEAMSNMNAGVPAMGGKSPVMPGDIFRPAAEKLAAVFTNTAGAAFPLDRILTLPHLQGDDVSAVADDLLGGQLDLDALAEGSGFNAETIALFLHSLFVPFFEREAEPYSQAVMDREIKWTSGICPVCGAPPRYAVYYDDKGYRKLYCGLCRTQWPYPRHKCPVCENLKGTALRIMTLGEDQAHMAEACESCKSYIKATDERKLLRECLPVIEDVVTAVIDIAATKEGYSRAA
jgi:FdhE protein